MEKTRVQYCQTCKRRTTFRRTSPMWPWRCQRCMNVSTGGVQQILEDLRVENERRGITHDDSWLD